MVPAPASGAQEASTLTEDRGSGTSHGKRGSKRSGEVPHSQPDLSGTQRENSLITASIATSRS